MQTPGPGGEQSPGPGGEQSPGGCFCGRALEGGAIRRVDRLLLTGIANAISAGHNCVIKLKIDEPLHLSALKGPGVPDCGQGRVGEIVKTLHVSQIWHTSP